MNGVFDIPAPAFVRASAVPGRTPHAAQTYVATPPPTPRSASQNRDLALNDLVAAFMAHREDDASGYGSEPSNRASFGLAVRLLCALPPSVPDPDVSVDPDGEAALEWYAAPRQTFSVSVGDDGLLRYAALLGEEEIAGRVSFDGRTVPPVISALAHRAVRPA